VLALPGPITAHSLLVESTPAANATLSTLPRELVLRFNNRIEKKLSKVRLVGAKGERLDVPMAVDGRADTLTGVLPALAPGAWRLEWQVLSTDGHVVTGAFSFRLGP
jgi:methionine-rich copper-binding protein CopC